MEMKKDNIIPFDRDLLCIYEFLRSEGLSLTESIQLVNKLEDIYQEISVANKPYSISDISSNVIKFFEDGFFDDDFISCLLKEASQTNVSWGDLYSTLFSSKMNIEG